MNSELGAGRRFGGRNCGATSIRRRSVIGCATLLLLLGAVDLEAAVVVARNGMVLDGKLGYLASIDVNPLVTQDPAAQVNQIVLVDDGLRRTYLSNFQVESLGESDPTGYERIRIRQNVASGRRQIGSVTAIRRIGPFNAHGQRVFSIVTPRGPVDVFQGITEITPVYTRVQGLTGSPSIRWDCRIATSSLPRETLSQVLRSQGVKHGAEARTAVVRLLVQAERYHDARLELEEAMREFPELESLQRLLVELRQYSASRLIDEIELRQDSGQHHMCRSLLAQFPEEGVAPEALQRVRQLVRAYQRRDALMDRLKQGLASLIDEVREPSMLAALEPFQAEVAQSLSANTVDRLQDFMRLQDDPKLTPDVRLALYVSGWLLGAGNATQNLSEAISLIRARDLVLRYLRAATEAERVEILSALGREEGGTPHRVVQLLGPLEPPLATEPQADRPVGGFRIEVPGINKSQSFFYEVQLPAEYDPLRRYPTVVTLHGLGRTPQQQIEWWAGSVDPERNARFGQASRHGYIVVAPHWLPSGQRQYEYSGLEHAAVLACLRDACRRFAVDTDRVFLSGHSIGGDAVWDIGLAHPDQWAGVIPVVAVGDYGPDAPKYISQYWPNAVAVPLYFVMGELDGNKLELNRRDFDRYLKRPGMDVMITEYIGRGHEHFYEEIHRIFDWMQEHRRDFDRDEYEFVTMRPFDNFFFHLELDQLPARSMVGPFNWPAPRALPAKNSFEKTAVGSLRVQTGAASAWLWLTPQTTELDGRLAITVNGRSRTYPALPEVQVVLEDARSRADRQHPFWARVELRTGERPTR